MGEKNLTLLGSTGSIGKNTLDVVNRSPGRFRVYALAAHSNISLLREQIAAHRPALAAVYDPEAAEQLRRSLSPSSGTTILEGMEGLVEVATAAPVNLVVAGIVGAVGLRPTYAAIEAGKQVALANKETLVLAGELMMRVAEQSGSLLLPMDSEHNAIFQCLGSADRGQVARIVLTASGGPFRDLPPEQFGKITLAEALAHPNWKMGPKITVDSATMMNKGLEVIEARWLFGLEPPNVQVLIHRQSIVHSLVEFIDGSVIAQLGLPDMRVPIAYCLAYPARIPLDLPRLELAKTGRLDFEEVSEKKFPCLFMALEALRLGGGAPAALNGANEVVVASYLEDSFPFTEIAAILKKTMTLLGEASAGPAAPSYLLAVKSVEDAIAADEWGRQTAASLLENA